MHSNLRIILESLPSDTPEIDRYVVESIFEHSSYKLETGCILWNGPCQHSTYPIYTSDVTGTLPIRPFMYRMYRNPTHNYGKIERLRLSCASPLCIAPDHLFLAKNIQSLRSDFFSRHRRAIAAKEQSSGNL